MRAMTSFWIAGLAAVCAGSAARASDVQCFKDPETNQDVCMVTVGDTVARLMPSAGANLFSIKYKGTELLRQPKSLKDLPGFMYGTPVIYPMPNRVRDGKFVFDGKTYSYTPNNNGNFLHGLVHNVPWKLERRMSTSPSEGLGFRCSVDFAEGTELHKQFPFPHTFILDITVTDGAVRWTYTVDNSKGEKPVPVGLALHPWFLYHGSRANTFLTIPATHLMESEKLLPTGKLLPLDGTKFDARQPKSLEGFVIDDVYFGMTPDKPAKIEFRDANLTITLKASEDFTHMVVYTPEEPWLCVENQTCSTDAHNLFHQGLKKEAHLIVVEPGKTATGYAEFQFTQSK